MVKKYIVDLSKDEKAELVSLTQKGRPGAGKIKRANILLLVDSGKPDIEVTELLHTRRNAVRATIDWRFTIPNARDKRKKLYLVGEE